MQSRGTSKWHQSVTGAVWGVVDGCSVMPKLPVARVDPRLALAGPEHDRGEIQKGSHDMAPVICERCRIFKRRLGKRCINCGFQVALMAGMMLVGIASTAHAQVKISQFQNEPGSAALMTDALVTESSQCPLSNGQRGNCRTTVQQILNAGLSLYLTAGAVTGSGNTVLANSPTLVAPALGTPSAVNLTNATSLPCSAMPALTGSVATTAGSCLTTGGGGGGSGSVTTVSVATANGLAGTVATASTTPAITLSTTATGILKGSTGAFVAAVAGTDFLAPTPVVASAAGTNQGNATVIATTTTVFTTVASGTGAKLALPFQIVVNAGANALLVYPNSGASITGGGASLSTNAPFTISAGSSASFYCTSSSVCYAAFSSFQ